MKRLKRWLHATMCALLLSPLAAHAEENYEHLFNNPEMQAAFIQAKIREHFPGDAAEAMIAIAECESTGWIHWLPDGSLRPHATQASSARGVLQILFKLHGPDIENMGLDMSDIDDYMVFARHLYDTQGPQNAWEECVVQMPDTVLAMLD